MDKNISEFAKDASLEVVISTDKSQAFVKLSPPLNGGKNITKENIMNSLAAAGVVYGIDQNEIGKIISFPHYRKNELVAQSLPAVKGKDSGYTLHFEPTSSSLPKELEDGSVDFKQLGLVKSVREGEVLCVKIPSTPGTAGKNVLGQVIAPIAGKDKPLPKGKGTELSEDGSIVTSLMDGQVDFVKDKINVCDTFEIKGDVDYHTGNIDFVGNVHINGNVLTGFNVRAEGNITIEGCVEGCRIEAGGNIFVQQGINGANIAVVESGGDLRCKYLQNAQGFAEMNFETELCVNGKVRCGGNVKAVGRNSKIIASTIISRHTISCVDVGAVGSTAVSVLEVGVDPATHSRHVNIPKEINELQNSISDIERKIDLFQKLKALGRLDEEKDMILERLTSNIKQKNVKVGHLVMEKLDIDQRMMTLGYGSINVTGTAYQGTKIVMGTEIKKLEKDYKRSFFNRTENGIEVSAAR